jgi:hypothetical protein
MHTVPHQNPTPQATNALQDSATSEPHPEVGEEACPRCGVMDRPTLGPGRGPHAFEAFCAHCHKHIRWVSVLAPAERHARRVKARLEAMRHKAPSEAQLALLVTLGDQGPTPENMAEASIRIEKLKGA